MNDAQRLPFNEAAAIGPGECCVRAAIGLGLIVAVSAGVVTSPAAVLTFSLLGFYLMQTVIVAKDPLYYLAARLHVPDRVQVWEYIAASGVLVLIVKGGHVHGAVTVLLFVSYAAFLAIVSLINRDGDGLPAQEPERPDAGHDEGYAPAPVAYAPVTRRRTDRAA